MTVRADAPSIELRQPIGGVLIGTPMYGGVNHDAYLLGVNDAFHEFAKHDIPLSIMTIRNESLIHRARNRIVAEFLASRLSHLIFIDADIGFVGRDILRLLAHDKPVIGATYAKKNQQRTDFAFVPLPWGVEVTEGHLVEIAMLPGGFMCLSRDAVVQLAGAFRHRQYVVPTGEAKGEGWEQHLYCLFESDIDPQTRNLLSEDYLFCQRWRDIGGKVWLDPNIILEHHGTAMFTGDPTAIFRVAEPPTAGDGHVG